MSQTYTGVSVRGQVVEEVFGKLLHLNSTLNDELVTFEEGIKAGTIITETDFSPVEQAYVDGTPTASGTDTITEREVTPTKIEVFNEFSFEAMRSSRFKRDMAAGAWNIDSSELTNIIMDQVGAAIAKKAEDNFWNGATSATKTTVSGLTSGTAQTSVGAAEKTLVAATPTTLVDGVVTYMIYNNSAVGGRIKVVGTTVSSSNIAAEYAKVYAVIPAAVLNNGVSTPYIYAPYSHKQLINIYNVSATYRDLFSVDIAANKYFYNGIEIKFVPLPENTMICALKQHIMWLTDLLADVNMLEIQQYAKPNKLWYYDAVMTRMAHIIRQGSNVLYVG